MEVILQNDFPSLGYVGDRVNVANGYARNFLIPRGIAVEASSRNQNQINHLLSAINKKRARLRAEAEEFAKKLEGLVLEFALKVGEGGKTFGAITSKDLEAALKAKGHDILRKQIKLHEPLKKAGEYQIQIKLHSEVTGTIGVRMQLEGLHPKAEGKDAKAKKGTRGRKAKGKDGEAQDASADAEHAAAPEAPATEEGAEKTAAEKKPRKKAAKKTEEA